MPQDLAADDAFPNEWWYYTGSLVDEDGVEYAFHVSFFKHWATDERRFGVPVRWIDNPARFAHGALTNLSTLERDMHEVTGIGRRGTAGADSDRFYVWTGGWSTGDGGDETHELEVSLGRAALELQFDPLKPLIVHAGDGTGKPPSAGKSRSYYISSTRMAVTGQLRLRGGETSKVTGTGWFDHETIGMDVARGARGWDWFALQLDDGSELVIYQPRGDDGKPREPVMIALIDPRGRREDLASHEFEIEALQQWISPRSNARYPVRWRIEIPGRDLRLRLDPVLVDSEVRGRLSQITYWEGFVRVTGSRNGRPLSGQGYVELTGYDKSMRKL